MRSATARLIFMCGKMAAGKSTLARALAEREDAVPLVQDEWLGHLFPGEITDISSFFRCSTRLQAALTPHVCALLSRGVTVVLDFPGNTRTQRAWFRDLFAHAHVAHELHFVDVPDAVCRQQLKARSAALPAGSRWTTDAEFDAITTYFQPPTDEEGFTIVRHARA